MGVGWHVLMRTCRNYNGSGLARTYAYMQELQGGWAGTYLCVHAGTAMGGGLARTYAYMQEWTARNVIKDLRPGGSQGLSKVPSS